jgi:hypothetical protein
MKTLRARVAVATLLLAWALPRPVAAAASADWTQMNGQEFVAAYRQLATGSQQQQSQFAWMMFALLNQQVTNASGTFSAWELWPSDQDTFNPTSITTFDAKAPKLRTKPHLQESAILKALRLTQPKRFAAVPPTAGEEVTRNAISYGYITGKGLNTLAGIEKFFATPGAQVDFPLGAIETKASWSATSPGPGAYSVGGVYLTALHIMVKIAPRPANPFTDNTPSWFWTTFEYKGNTDLAAAQKFITYHDALTPQQSLQILTQAGLAGTAFVNYACNGPQIQFADASHRQIILGNTQLEGFLAVPGGPPAQWTSWPTSCHTCHSRAGATVTNNAVNFIPAYFGTGVTGMLTPAELPPAGYQSFDFVWAFFNAQ